MPTAVATSTLATTTAFGSQRKLDRTSNGVLWAFINESGAFSTSYSTDNGATWSAKATAWTNAGSGTGTNSSFFIDQDDYAHVAYKVHNEYVYYRRGTPNAGRTAWTWSAATQLTADTLDYPDVVAFRTPGSSPTTWDVAVVASYNAAGLDAVLYERLRIANDGTVTAGNLDGLSSSLGMGRLSAVYSNSFHKWPSIDFNHTGDGKTVAGGTPHLYVGWSSGATGAGNGVRFKKATYSAGAWSWGTEREMDTARYANNTSDWLLCQFDGTRVTVAGFLYDGTSRDLILHDRDAGDTATTARVLLDNAAAADQMFAGSAAYDSAGNVYLFGRDGSGANGTRLLNRRKWTRSGASLGAITTVDSTAPDTPHVSAKRGYSSSRIEILYRDGTVSPFSVTYDAVALNSPPNAPILLTPIGSAKIDRAIVQRFDWDFSDPDAGDSQSKYDLRYRIVGAGTWTDVTVTTPNTFHDFAANTFAAGDYEWQVRTYDAAGTVGPYSSSEFFTAADAPPQPTITDPINGATVSSSHTVQWSAPNQGSYQLRRIADNAGAPNTGTVYEDTGEVVTTSARSRSVTFAVNNRWEHVQVRVKYNGLWSAYASHRANVSYTPPAAPTVILAAENATGSLLVNITNPTPGGGQPPVTHNEVEVDDGSGWERRAASVTPSTAWRYWLPKSGRSYTGRIRVTSVGDNGTKSTTTA